MITTIHRGILSGLPRLMNDLTRPLETPQAIAIPPTCQFGALAIASPSGDVGVMSLTMRKVHPQADQSLIALNQRAFAHHGRDYPVGIIPWPSQHSHFAAELLTFCFESRDVRDQFPWFHYASVSYLF
jgi:hypothetical protein